MKKVKGFVVFFIYTHLSCQTSSVNPDPGLPGESIAVVGAYTNILEKYLTTCVESWHITIDGQYYRSRTLPKAFQRQGLNVWVKYQTDSTGNWQSCKYVKLISIRKR